MEITNLKQIFNFYFVNIGITVTPGAIHQQLCVHDHNVVMEGSISQIF